MADQLIHVYAIAWNEEVMLPHFIRHYRERFPGCPITILDNGSTDRTREVATDAGCELVAFESGGQLDDDAYLRVKESCWRDCREPWAVVVDADEFVAADRGMLESCGADVIKCRGYNMVCDGVDSIAAARRGVLAWQYGKMCVLRPDRIARMNWSHGCHRASPAGKSGRAAAIADGICPLWHMRFPSVEYVWQRHLAYQQRMSAFNRANGLGAHYWQSRESIAAEYRHLQEHAYVVR